MRLQLHALVSAVLSLCVLFGSGSAWGQSRPYTPKAGSFERKLLMDTLRVPVEAKLKQPVIFKVDFLRAQNGWAFLRAMPQKPGGKPVDYRKTVYWAALKAGAFDNGVCALLHKTAGRWRVVTYNIGATDVVYQDWDKRFHAPHAIFGIP